MTKANCNEVRRELDEMRLEDNQSVVVTTHLRECSECRDFQEKQTRLRQIVGSLGTVSAPADFDFRLRARLATENPSSGFHFGRLLNFGQRSAAIAMALVLLIGAIVVVRYVGTRPTTTPEVAKKDNVKPNELPTPKSEPSQKIVAAPENDQVAVVGSTPDKGLVGKRTPVSRAQRSTPPLATRDTSGTGAEVINLQPTAETEPIFPVDASHQSLRVSVFDRKGNPKTISVPSVSFGSQRVVPVSTAYAPKGVW